MSASAIPEEILVLGLSSLPIVELRGGIPLGIAHFEMSPLKVFFLASAGNMIPVLPLLLFLGPVCQLFSRRSRLFDKAFSRLTDKTRPEETSLVSRYGLIGLALFVAIPSPATGAWTGCLIAFLADLPKGKASLAIGVGVLAAGAIVTGATTGVLAAFQAVFSPAVSAALFISLVIAFFVLGRLSGRARRSTPRP